MNTLKKFWKFISSMQFAIILLVLLAAACSFASFVTQGQTYAWYAETYSERKAALIMALHLDDAFHSWWFITITAFLCVNLLLCNILKFPQNAKRMKNAADAAAFRKKEGQVSAKGVRDFEAFAAALHFGNIKHVPAEAAADTTEEAAAAPESGSGEESGREEPALVFAAKNQIGFWGAWVCHLGILLLILGFGLGQMTKQTYSVYGVPGQSRAIGDTGYIVTIDSFDIGLRKDDTVEQYTAGITVRNADGGAAESAEISVNNPADLFGMRFYQNSTGYAAKIHIFKNGELIQEEVVCAGDYIPVKDKPDLVIYLNAFYPDYVMTPGAGPGTASSEIRNPAYLYSVYYMNRMLGMNALLQEEELTIDEYTVTFDEPQHYTLVQIKKERFAPLALLGGLVTLLGLVIAFYLQPAQIWAKQEEDGTYTVYGQSPKGGVMFRDAFLKAAEEGAEQ